MTWDTGQQDQLINFRTVSMTTGGAGNLEHIVAWDALSGNVANLTNVYTRECVQWDAAPAEFGMAGEYASAGEHHGLGQNNATGGTTTDNHSIIPTGFKPESIPDGSSSPNWVMRQEYQVKSGDGDWQPIPGATYEITRWFERRDHTTLVAYCAKRGTGNDTSAHQAMVEVPNFFEIEVGAPDENDFTLDQVDREVVDGWNERALKDLNEGDQTAFYEFEDLIIIKHPTLSAGQPYVTWASTQDWAVAGAFVQMVKKGGVFSPGSIKAVGVKNTRWFEEAVARVSKKTVEY